MGALGAGLVDFSPGLLTYVKTKWGGGAIDRLQSWRERELEVIKSRADDAKKPESAVAMESLAYLNKFWNRIPYISDYRHWGVEDYWATPIEALASNGADCEDYSIAKYFSIKELGIKPENLRITYVLVRATKQAHMVLAYYPTPDADPYILDNLTGRLLPASERDDLEPVYSFNDDELWVTGQTQASSKSSKIRSWNDLLEKMAAEKRL